jgi:hypothetical protein
VIAPQRFDRRATDEALAFARLGDGELGGKANGLLRMREVLASRFDAAAFPEFVVTLPRLVVITTDHFAAFMRDAKLDGDSLAALPDDRIAHAFLRAELPMELIGDLRALIQAVHTPLAVRSSSLLEDAREHPFAGVYGTKMTPNNQPDTDSRFRRLLEAIKFVYASTYFHAARSYREAVGCGETTERMAVILQEVVGRRHGDRFYPTVSGVARSFNFYASGNARPDEGVVELALGLGKTIVDGEVAWAYSPAYPRAPRPYNSIGELLKSTQTRFWAVNMGFGSSYDPIRETEYMVQAELADAEADGCLRFVASTYDADAHRIVPGIGRRGPRLVDFAPLLAHNLLPLNELVRAVLAAGAEELGGPVEIEFAATLDVPRGEPAQFGFLQVRPMTVVDEEVEVGDEDLASAAALVASEHVLGNGSRRDIVDVVYLKPETFVAEATPAIAGEVEAINRELVAAGRRYALIGFGRWGTSDPTGGVPCEWGQIAGASVIVETGLPGMAPELSQGSHFFHNLTSFRVLYFSVPHATARPVDWAWLARQPAVCETRYLRRLELSAPLTVKVDGRRSRGVILRHG